MAPSKPTKASGGFISTLKKAFKVKKAGSGREEGSGNDHSTKEPTNTTPIEPPPDSNAIPFASPAEPQVETTPAIVETASPPAITSPGCDEQVPQSSHGSDASLPSNGSSLSPNPPIKPTAQDIVMVVMGPTGVGKTTFIDSFSESYASRPFKLDDVGHHDLTAGTKDVRVVRFTLKETGENLVLVDTPGFDDPDRSNSVVLKCIADHLVETYKKQDFLHGIIYLHRITDVRFDAGASAALNIFKKLYGSEGYNKLALVTTMWNDIKPEMKFKYEEKEEELKKEAWGAFLKRSNPALVARYDSTDDAIRRATALKVVTDLMLNHLSEQSKSTPDIIKLQIQREMVDEGKSLPRTEAGKAAFTLAETASFYLKELSG